MSTLTAGVLNTTDQNLSSPNDFDAPTWTLTDMFVGTGISDPDGGSNASSIIGDTAQFGQYIERFETLDGGFYTFKVKAKAPSPLVNNWLQIDTPYVSDSFAYFNLTTGEVGQIGNAAHSARTTTLSNGWYKFELTFDSVVGTNNIRIRTTSTNGGLSGGLNGEEAFLLYDAELFKDVVNFTSIVNNEIDVLDGYHTRDSGAYCIPFVYEDVFDAYGPNWKEQYFYLPSDHWLIDIGCSARVSALTEYTITLSGDTLLQPFVLSDTVTSWDEALIRYQTLSGKPLQVFLKGGVYKITLDLDLTLGHNTIRYWIMVRTLPQRS